MNHFNKSRTSEPQRRQHPGVASVGLFFLSCASLFVTGCYDSQALIKAHKAEAERTHLVEVELGDYRISLPKPFQDLERAEVHFDAFGYVPQNALKSIQKQLKDHHAELDHRVLIAIRQLELQQISEPTLETLRQEVHRAVNETVANSALQEVGFRKFGFSSL